MSKEFPAGTIIVLSDYISKFSQFNISLMETQMPVGTTIQYSMGKEEAKGKNDSLRDATGDWAWFITDEYMWEPDLLLNLLKHDLDVVGPLTLSEKPPFQAQCYESIDENGSYVPYNLMHSSPKIVEVMALSTPGMLVKKDVFKDIKYPWFEIGKIDSSIISDDLYFSQKVRREGYKVHVDLASSMSHFSVTNITPVFNDNTWGSKMALNDKGLIIPLAEVEEYNPEFVQP